MSDCYRKLGFMHPLCQTYCKYSTHIKPHACLCTCHAPGALHGPSPRLPASSCSVWGDRHTCVTPHSSSNCCKPGRVVFLACSKQTARLLTNNTHPHPLQPATCFLSGLSGLSVLHNLRDKLIGADHTLPLVEC